MFVQDRLHNDTSAAKWYQFDNWAEPSIKQVSKATNRNDQDTTTISFFFRFTPRQRFFRFDIREGRLLNTNERSIKDMRHWVELAIERVFQS